MELFCQEFIVYYYLHVIALQMIQRSKRSYYTTKQVIALLEEACDKSSQWWRQCWHDPCGPHTRTVTQSSALSAIMMWTDRFVLSLHKLMPFN